jgi:hypothetical protein
MKENLVAFICISCAVCSGSVCSDCFKNGNHINHDYSMFLHGGDCGKLFQSLEFQ